MERQGEILGKALAVRIDGVSQDEVLWTHRLLADLDDEGLLGLGLRQVVAQPLSKAGPLPLEIRHCRQHGDRIPAGGMRLGVQDHLLTGFQEGLLGQRAPQKL